MASEQDEVLDPEVLADPAASGAEKPDSGKVVEAEVVSAGSLAKYDPFRAYMAELKKYPPLSREEEQELARRYRETGDRDAMFRLVTANLILVVRIAMSFRRAAKNLLDLIQEGNVGLLQAIDRFDPEMGNRLPTYAAWWIRAYMVKFLLDNVRLVRVGTTNSRRKLLRNLRKEQARLEAQGFDVGTKMLAEHLDVSENDVKEVQAALASHDVSMDAPMPGGDEDGRNRGDLMAEPGPDVEETVARRQLQDQAEQALDEFRVGLGKRDRVLLDERIVSDDPITLQAVGDRFGTSREAVRQAEVRLMKRLRQFLTDRLGDLGQIRIGPS